MCATTLTAGTYVAVCGQTFDQSLYTLRLGVFPAGDDPIEQPSPSEAEEQATQDVSAAAAKAEEMYQTKLEASAAERATNELERQLLTHDKQMKMFALEKQLVVERANKQALVLREHVEREAHALAVEAAHQRAEAAAQFDLQQAKLEASQILADAVAASAQVQRQAREAMAQVIAQKKLSARPLWHHADTCKLCGTSFGFLFVRRHHCRKCGGSFCNACAGNFAPIPALGFQEPVRQCNTCLQPATQPHSWTMQEYLTSWLVDWSSNDGNDEFPAAPPATAPDGHKQPSATAPPAGSIPQPTGGAASGRLDPLKHSSPATPPVSEPVHQTNCVTLSEEQSTTSTPKPPAPCSLGKGAAQGKGPGKGGKGKGPPQRGGAQCQAMAEFHQKREAAREAAQQVARKKAQEAAANPQPRKNPRKPPRLDFEKELRARILLGTAGLKSAKDTQEKNPATTQATQAKGLSKSSGSNEMAELTAKILSRRGQPDSSDDDLDWEASGNSVL